MFSEENDILNFQRYPIQKINLLKIKKVILS